MGGLDPGEKGGDEALSVLALLWVETVDDQGCDVVLAEGDVRLPPRTWIPDDAIQLTDLVIDAGHLLAPDMEVAEVDVCARRPGSPGQSARSDTGRPPLRYVPHQGTGPLPRRHRHD